MRVVLALILLGGVAFAQKDSARAHYEKATSHFALGEFDQAAEQYQLAYRAKPDAALLYNAAQSFRLANKLEKALVLYKNYVNLYPRERNVPEVRAQIERLKVAIASAEHAKSSPPISTVEPKPSESQPGATAPVPPPRAEPEKKPLHKKWWLWTIVGGVVVVGAVVTVAVLMTTPSGPWSNAEEIGPGSRNGLAIEW